MVESCLVSNRQIIEKNFIFKSIRDYSKQNGKINLGINKTKFENMILVMKSTNRNFKGRFKKGIKRASFTKEELYNTLYNDLTSSRIKKDRMKDLEKFLSIFTKYCDSIYGKQRLIDEIEKDSEKFYRYVDKKDIWNRTSYNFIPKIFSFVYNKELNQAHDNLLAEKVLCSAIVLAMQDLIIRKEQLENLFGLSIEKFKYVLSELGIKTIEKQTTVNNVEKRAYGLLKPFVKNHKFEKMNKLDKSWFICPVMIPRGIYVKKEHISIAENFIQSIGVKIDYNSLFLIQELIYNNSIKIEKESFKTKRKNLSSNQVRKIQNYEKFLEEYNRIRNQKNQISNHFKLEYVNERTFNSNKAKHFQNIFNLGSRNYKNDIERTHGDRTKEEQNVEKLKEQKIFGKKTKNSFGNRINKKLKEQKQDFFDCVSEFKDDKYSQTRQYSETFYSPLTQELEYEIGADRIEALCSLTSFDKFCTKSQKLFEEIVLKKKTFKRWINLKTIFLHNIVKIKPENFKIIAKQLLEVNSIQDAMRSPIFNNTYYNYQKMDDVNLMKYVKHLESELQKMSEFYDSLEFRKLILTLKKDIAFKENIKEFKTIVEDFQKEFGKKKFLKQQKEELSSLKEFFKKNLVSMYSQERSKECDSYVTMFFNRILSKKSIVSMDQLKEMFNLWLPETKHHVHHNILKGLYIELNSGKSDFVILKKLVYLIRKGWGREFIPSAEADNSLSCIESFLKEQTISEKLEINEQNISNGIKEHKVSIKNESEKQINSSNLNTISIMDQLKQKVNSLELKDVSIDKLKGIEMMMKLKGITDVEKLKREDFIEAENKDEEVSEEKEIKMSYNPANFKDFRAL